MQYMIIMGWNKCGIDNAFIHKFQLKAMLANVESSLFKVTANFEENIEEDNIIDPTIPLNNIVSKCLAVDVHNFFLSIFDVGAGIPSSKVFSNFKFR